MIPILFTENSTTFTTNGIGRLADAISCTVQEQRNGVYELEMEYPKTGRHYSDLGVRKIIVAKPSANASLQAFRIYKITKPIDGRVVVFAQHLCYDLVKNVAMPFSVTASASACNNALQGLKSNAVETCPFSFWTDVTTVSSYTQLMPSSINQRLRGIEGSIIDQFGGEYEFDNWTVKLHKHRGEEKPITLRYGKNITDLDQEENIANTVTGVVPFWINTDKTESVTLPEKVVRSSNASRYSHYLTVPLDLSTEFKEKPNEEQLRTKATVYVNQSGFGLPKVSIKVSFVELADTEEYKSVLPLQAVSLCDTITVQFEELGINTTAEVVETDYDVLNERYNSVQIGALKSTLAMSINDMNASTIQAVQDESERVYADVNNDVSDMVDNATAWLTSGNGYVVAVKNNDGSWKELLFMDDDDIATAINVLRINENGIGFSSDGAGGPYKQGWTLDGNILIGGSNASGLTVYKRVNGIDTIMFQVTPNKIIWDTPNSTMDANGKLTITNADITDGTISLGGNNNGVLKVYDEDNYLMGEWTREHLMFKKPRSYHTIEMKVEDGNSVLMFDDDSYIDGTGSGGEDGFHINANNVTFSVDDIHVTNYRGDSLYSTGYTGDVTMIDEIVIDDDRISWGFVTLDFVNGICVGNSRD